MWIKVSCVFTVIYVVIIVFLLNFKEQPLSFQYKFYIVWVWLIICYYINIFITILKNKESK